MMSPHYLKACKLKLSKLKANMSALNELQRRRLLKALSTSIAADVDIEVEFKFSTRIVVEKCQKVQLQSVKRRIIFHAHP